MGSAFLAKITRPAHTGVLQRKRLFRLLDIKCKQPIVWVSGPPGSGKTVLASSYIDAGNLQCLWYQADEGDSDIATFFYYMGLAVKKASPHKRNPMPLLTPEYQMGVPAFTRRYFEELFRRLEPPFIIVLDNYQEVATQSQLHEVMREGLSYVPEGINIVIISRSSVPKELVRLRANEMLSLVKWEDLRLTPEESEGIIHIRRPVPVELMELLHEKASGWVAGLVLMIEAMDTEGLVRQYPGSFSDFSHNEVFGYFAHEVFDNTDPETQDFLLKTSLLSGMTAKMTECLTGLSRSDEILSTLYQENYFILKRPESNNTYQYHPLFREFLLAYAKTIYPPDKLFKLSQKAAALLEEAGEIEEVARLYIKSEDWQGLSRLIMKQAKLLIMHGRNQVLAQWLKSLPEDIFNSTPWLIYWLGASRLPFDPPLSLSCFEQTFKQFSAQEDQMGMFMSCFGAINAILYEQADFKLLDSWISMLEDLFRSDPYFPSPEVKARAISSMFISLLLRQPCHPDIEEWAERVLTVSRCLQDANLRILSEIDVSLYYQWTGRFAAAEEVIAPLRNLARQSQTTSLAFTTLKAFEAMNYSLKGMHESCLAAVSEGLKVAQSTGVNTMLCQILTHGASSSLGAGDLDRARQFLEKIALMNESPQRMNMSYYKYLLAWEALLHNDLINAHEHITIALDLVVKIGFPFMEAMIRYGMAQVLFGRGEHQEAAENLAMTWRIGRGMKSHMIEFMCLLSDARFALDQGKEHKGLESLKQAMALGRKHGFTHFIFWRPDVMARLCVEALQAGLEKEYVFELVKKRNLVPEHPPLEVENWPWPVRIYTLGRFGLVVDGEPVRFLKKSRQKPLSLLKALIAFGGRGVSTGRIIDALWPDALGDAAISAFTTTVQRLRRILGGEAAVLVSGGKVTLNPVCCWVDAWAFERILSEAEAVVEHGKKRERRVEKVAGLFEKASGMYSGHFLKEDIDFYWTVSMRERLRSRFLRHIVNIGEYLQQNGGLKKAIELYQKGLEVDYLSEEIYQQLMKCYGEIGYRGEVERVYRMCLKTLSTLLGVMPSHKTEAIYRKAVK
ncbi:MAG TPA: hypothetical protein ENH17_04625 [Nitrospirae bacterium]|nr:hypothetical protein [Nitrospirota bacterium]